MKLKKIAVKNLFGMFNHEVPLNIKDHITIIHGPNGFGKTMLLTVLKALFSSGYGVLRSIPFSELSVEFDDKSTLKLKKKIEPNEERRIQNHQRYSELVFEFGTRRGKVKIYTVKPLRENELQFPFRLMEREVAGLERVDAETWIYSPTQEKLSLEEVIDRFKNRIPYKMPGLKSEPDWFKKLKDEIHIRFIESQRLLSFPYFRHPRDYREYERPSSMVPSVVTYSKELAETIQAKLAEYATLSQSLDRTFPTRLVKGRTSNELTIDGLGSDLNKLEEKRSRLIAAGFLDKEKEIDFRELQKIDKSNINVLSVYIEDVKRKLSVFDELTNKIDLLVNIINNRFLYKQTSISKKDGFIFKTSDNKILTPTSLSSGEQHELVLLYELLFGVKENSLVLIDEPELSLHVIWQQQFLNDLQEITKLTGFDVLIATHSPQIIHDRWDLTVELEGPNEKVPHRQ